jgi:hypothetical protein
MVFVDAANRCSMSASPHPSPGCRWRSLFFKAAARFGVMRCWIRSTAKGLVRLGGVDDLATLSRGTDEHFMRIARGPNHNAGTFAAPPLAPDIPLIVLVHEKFDGFVPPAGSAGCGRRTKAGQARVAQPATTVRAHREGNGA